MAGGGGRLEVGEIGNGQEGLSEAQAARLACVPTKGSTLKTARAYGWRLRFDAFFNQPAELAGAYLEVWWRGAVHSRLEPMVRFAHTRPPIFRRHPALARHAPQQRHPGGHQLAHTGGQAQCPGATAPRPT
jgi:hypothetical protein